MSHDYHIKYMTHNDANTARHKKGDIVMFHSFSVTLAVTNKKQADVSKKRLIDGGASIQSVQ